MAKFASQACDPKFSAEVWRCIATLCTGKLFHSMDRLTLATSNCELNSMEYLLLTVETGCYCIQNSIEEICKVH